MSSGSIPHRRLRSATRFGVWAPRQSRCCSPVASMKANRFRSRAIVQAALARDPQPALEPAVASHVLHLDDKIVRFVHPLYAAAVYSRGSPAERRELHRRLAVVVSDIEERARHLALATEAADDEVSAALGEAAARLHVRGRRAGRAGLCGAAGSL